MLIRELGWINCDLSKQKYKSKLHEVDYGKGENIKGTIMSIVWSRLSQNKIKNVALWMHNRYMSIFITYFCNKTIAE
jgi:hypothetical protein